MGMGIFLLTLCRYHARHQMREQPSGGLQAMHFEKKGATQATTAQQHEKLAMYKGFASPLLVSLAQNGFGTTQHHAHG
jgi:hypothetical protein